jgi:aminopeptidase YwaD
MLHFAKASTTVLDINELDSSQISFYPNPASTILNISLGSLTESDYSFSLVDIQGKEVLNKQIKNASLIETVSLQSIAKGMYLAVVQTNNKRVTKKIIID